MKKHFLATDFLVIALVIFLMSIGAVTLFSAADKGKVQVQLFAYCLGLIAIIVISFWDYRSIERSPNHIYFLSIFLLLIVFVFGIGKEETGAISWIRFGKIGVQPSEFVKILFCLYISCSISSMLEKNILNNPKELFIFILKCLPVIGLVVLQNDTGTALVFVFMLSACLFTSGIAPKFIITAIAVTLVILPLTWLLMSDYQRDRIEVFLNPEKDLLGSGYQVYLSKLAVSSGGIWGTGYRHGALNSLSYLPEKDTDFIFSILGEEFGFLGTSLTLIIFIILIFRCFYIARNATDNLGRIICTGVSSWLTFHVIENVSMTIGLLPVTGIPLPFVSYGGSSVLAISMAMGLILSVRRKTYNIHFN